MTAPRARSSRAAPVVPVAGPPRPEVVAPRLSSTAAVPLLGKAASRTASWALSLIASLSRCACCRGVAAGGGRGGGGVCQDCASWISAALANAAAPGDSLVWLGPYAGPWLRLVHALKYRGQRRLAAPLGQWLAERVMRSGFQPDLVTHVPASAAGLARRGFDQAEWLAKAVAQRSGAPYRAVLSRGEGSARKASQARLGLLARSGNAAGAFRSRSAAARRLLLVDDVMTTGATLSACQAALEAAGAVEVRLAVVARTIRSGARTLADEQ